VAGIATAAVSVATFTSDAILAGTHRDTPARIAETVVIAVRLVTARTILHATTTLALPGVTARARVVAAVARVALTAVAGQVAALVDPFAIHLPAATYGTGLDSGRRHQKRRRHNAQFQQSTHHNVSPFTKT